MKKLSISIILLLLCFSLIGCATIMHGPRQKVGISSAPIGASVIIDDKLYGETPLFANLSRMDNHIIKIEMPGYTPFAATVTCSISSWVLGNIFFFNLIGLAVDAMYGGLYKLSPEQVVGELRKEEMVPSNK